MNLPILVKTPQRRSTWDRNQQDKPPPSLNLGSSLRLKSKLGIWPWTASKDSSDVCEKDKLWVCSCQYRDHHQSLHLTRHQFQCFTVHINSLQSLQQRVKFCGQFWICCRHTSETAIIFFNSEAGKQVKIVVWKHCIRLNHQVSVLRGNSVNMIFTSCSQTLFYKICGHNEKKCQIDLGVYSHICSVAPHELCQFPRFPVVTHNLWVEYLKLKM